MGTDVDDGPRILDLSGQNLDCQIRRAGPPNNDIHKYEGATGGLLIQNGQIPVPVICGGLTNQCYRVGSQEPFAYMMEQRKDAASVVLSNERLWITGGGTGGDFGCKHDLFTTEFVYLNGTVEQGPDLPNSEETNSHCLVKIDDDTVSMTGGIDTGLSWVFNITEYRWISGPNMMAPREGHFCGWLRDRADPGKKLLVALGGYDHETDMYLESMELLVFGKEDSQWFAGDDFDVTIVRGQAVTTSDGLAWIVIGGTEHLDYDNIFYYAIFKMECTNEACQWTEMEQKLPWGMYRFVAMLVPDSMTSCA